MLKELDYFANARNDVKTIVIASHEVAWQSINNQFRHIEFVLCSFEELDYFATAQYDVEKLLAF